MTLDAAVKSLGVDLSAITVKWHSSGEICEAKGDLVDIVIDKGLNLHLMVEPSELEVVGGESSTTHPFVLWVKFADSHVWN